MCNLLLPPLFHSYMYTYYTHSTNIITMNIFNCFCINSLHPQILMKFLIELDIYLISIHIIILHYFALTTESITYIFYNTIIYLHTYAYMYYVLSHIYYLTRIGE